MQAALCILVPFAIVVVWLNYRHNVALTKLTLERLGMSHEGIVANAKGGFGLAFAGAATFILGPFLVMASAALYPIWRRSRAAWTTSSVAAGLLAGACALLLLALLVFQPFVGFDGDWDLAAAPKVVAEYDLVAGQNPRHWHQWALLSLPALGAIAILTCALQVHCLRRPSETGWIS
ncbi:hypothetical protein [Plantactinospora soyae]|uniref:Uncharacterized protein n=1 Tax=Plantactinospora soyae TaxID=1544732 RepID=A0A927MBU7_9ACTN|nr:hypothetical protein [Plantactinospora soyae]MBE1491868.1 hypothetical protein [Plantactinospora soyae]